LLEEAKKKNIKKVIHPNHTCRPTDVFTVITTN